MAQLQSSAITGSLTLSGSLAPIIFPGTNSRIEMGDPSGTDYSMNFRTNRYYYFQDNKTLYISGPVNARNRISNDQGTLILGSKGTNIMYLSGSSVGIGTSSPTTKLHVTGITQIAESGNSAFYGGNYVRVFNDQNFNFRNVSGTTVANISVNGTSYFNGGNVGIGTTSPANKLHVTNGQLQIGDSTSNHFGIRLTRTNASVVQDAHLYSPSANSPSVFYMEGGYWTGENAGTVTAANSGYAYYEKYFGNGANTSFKYFGFAKVANGNFTVNDMTASLTLKSDGNVGIGTTSPDTKLHVVTSGASKALNLYQASYQQFQFKYTDTYQSSFEFGSLGKLMYEGNGGYLILENKSTQAGSRIIFKASGSEYMRITHDGKVGIGTTSPGTRLDVADSEPIIRLTDTRNLNVGDWDDVSLGRIQFYTSDTTSPGARALAEIQAYSGVGAASGPEAELIFKTSTITDSSPVQRMVIDSDGRLGLGTTSPGETFQIHDSSTTGNPKIKIYGYDTATSTAKHGQIFVGTDGSFNITAQDNYLILSAANYVQSNSTHTFLQGILQSNNKGISMQNSQGSYKTVLITDSNNIVKVGGVGTGWTTGGDLALYSSGSEKVRINTSGNVGIGTTTPTEALDVNGNIVIRDTGTIRGIRRPTDGYNLQMMGGVDPTDGAYLSLGGDTRGGLGNAVAGEAKIVQGGAAYANRAAISSSMLFQAQYNGGSVTDIAIVGSTGYVGIGTTSPVELLDVDGTARAASMIVEGIAYAGTGFQHWGDGGTGVNFPANDRIDLDVASTTKIRITNDTDEGILINPASQGWSLGSYNNTSTYADIATIINGSTFGGLITGPSSGHLVVRIRNNDDNDSFAVVANSENSASAAPDKVLFRAKSTGQVEIPGDLTVEGIVTAQEFHTEFVSASIVYQSGSTKFGDDTGDNHSFTGSILLSGSYLQNGASDNSGKADFAIYTGEYPALSLVSNQVQIGSTDMNYVARFDYDATNVTIRSWEKDIRLMTQGSSTTQAIQFHTANSGTTSEKMRITGAGNVGIGTSSPAGTLHVVGTSGGAGEIYVSDVDNGAGSSDSLLISKSGTNAFIYNRDDGQISFGTNNVSNNLVITNTGNVGIGTTSPAYKLHVESGTLNTVAMFNSNDANAFIIISDSSTNSFLRSESNKFYVANSSTDNSTFNIDLSSGNVGIGTTSPSSKLTVTGNIEASGSALVATNDAADSIGLSLVSPASGVNVTFDFEVGDTGISNINPKNLVIKGSSGVSDIVFSPSTSYPGMMVLDGSTGRVGIGKTNPAYALDVSGSVRIATDNPLLILGDDENTVRYAATQYITNGGTWTLSSGDSNTGTGTNASDLWITRATDGSDNRFRFYRDSYAFGVYSGSAAGVVLDADGTSYFNGGNVGIGTTNPGSALEVNGTIRTTSTFQFYNTGGSVYAVGTYDASYYKFLTSGTERVRIDTSGNVGIGTTTPTSTLHVSGSTGRVNIESETAGSSAPQLYIEGNKTDGSPSLATLVELKSNNDFRGRGIKYTHNASSAEWFSGVPYQGGGFQIGYDGSIGRSEYNASASLFINTSGNVGIGTTNPSVPLEVKKGDTTQIISDRDGNGTNIVLRRSGVTRGVLATSNTSGGEFELYSSADLVLNASTGNNVGIGKTSPTSKLDVAGAVRALGLGSYFGNSATSYSYAVIGAFSNGVDNIPLVAKGYSGQTADLTRWVDSSNNILNVVDASGNVGIGTSTPTQKLEVVGQAIIDGGVGVGSAGTLHVRQQGNTANDGIAITSGFGTSHRIWKDANGTLNIGPSSDTDAFVQTVAGNVGIGTSTPGATLDISGSVKFQMYGQGDYTGTTAYRLAVDSSGNIIEESLGAGAVDGAGAANQVTVWSDSDTVSGSGDFTWDGTTLSINGTLEASEKSFNIKHPTKEDKRLIYGVLEGPEHAVYVRGKINTNVIELPEEWTGLVDEESITVQLTSIGSHQNLYVVDIKDNKIFIKNGNTFSSKINAFYFVQGTRKDIKPLITERDAN